MLAHAVLTRLHIANAEYVPGSGDVCCAALLPSKNETVLPGLPHPPRKVESKRASMQPGKGRYHTRARHTHAATHNSG